MKTHSSLKSEMNMMKHLHMRKWIKWFLEVDLLQRVIFKQRLTWWFSILISLQLKPTLSFLQPIISYVLNMCSWNNYSKINDSTIWAALTYNWCRFPLLHSDHHLVPASVPAVDRSYAYPMEVCGGLAVHITAFYPVSVRLWELSCVTYGVHRQDVSIDHLSIGQCPHQHYLPLPSPMSALLTPTRDINIIYQYHIFIIFWKGYCYTFCSLNDSTKPAKV